MAWHDPRAFNPWMMVPRSDILGLTSAQFVDAARCAGVSTNEAIQLYRECLRTGKTTAKSINHSIAPIVNTLHEHGTIKFIQRHADGLETESVILPYRGSTGRVRNTLCVSSQVGCAMGCTFCETAQMGLMRNLTAAQIVGQWFAATHLVLAPSNESPSSIRGEDAPARTRIDNIVFMGMGEPLDNLDHVMQAIEVLCDRNGPAIAPARVCVSTVGRVAGILRLAEMARTPGFRQLRLAVSINAPNNQIRSQIMPINRAVPMADLLDAMLQWSITSGGERRRVLIEYVLIPGVNDALEHADQLCEYLKPLTCTVNVIPYNPRRNSPWAAPTDEAVQQFVDRIHERGQFVKRRQTLGRSVMAACGQLGNPTIRGRRVVVEP